MTPETDAAVIASNGQWSFVLKETCQRLERERDEARELADAYKEYAQVLGVEINDMVIHAHVHGLKFSRFEQSKVLHEKIKQLEASK